MDQGPRPLKEHIVDPLLITGICIQVLNRSDMCNSLFTNLT